MRQFVLLAIVGMTIVGAEMTCKNPELSSKRCRYDNTHSLKTATCTCMHLVEIPDYLNPNVQVKQLFHYKNVVSCALFDRKYSH